MDFLLLFNKVGIILFFKVFFVDFGIFVGEYIDFFIEFLLGVLDLEVVVVKNFKRDFFFVDV